MSLSGFINYLDVNNPDKPLRIIKGHNRPITVLTLSDDRSSIFTGSHDGFVTRYIINYFLILHLITGLYYMVTLFYLRWNTENGENERIEGAGHGNQINGMRAHEGTVYTCGIDDSLKQIDIEGNVYKPQDLKLGSQPRGMDIHRADRTVVTASVNEITVSRDCQKKSVVKASYEPSSVSISGQGHVAVGGAGDNKVHLFELKGDELSPLQELEHLGPVTDVAYSPDDKYLVACDANRKVVLYETTEYKVSN